MVRQYPWQLDPDLLLCAKGLTSGYLPMGAVLVAPEVAEPFGSCLLPRRMAAWLHVLGPRHRGRCRVGEPGHHRAGRLGGAGGCTPGRPGGRSGADRQAPSGRRVRAGTGLLGAVQIDDEAQKADPKMPAKVALELRENGVLSWVLAGGALQISPAVVITEHELEQLATAIYDALEAVS